MTYNGAEIPQEPASSIDSSVEEPVFSFMGTDGEYYSIGDTPHEFVLHLEEHFNEQDPKAPKLTRVEIDTWIWFHMRAVPGQRHLLLEDVQKLYFEIDLPNIMNEILNRLATSQQALVDALNIVADRADEITSMLHARQHNFKEVLSADPIP